MVRPPAAVLLVGSAMLMVGWSDEVTAKHHTEQKEMLLLHNLLTLYLSKPECYDLPSIYASYLFETEWFTLLKYE